MGTLQVRGGRDDDDHNRCSGRGLAALRRSPDEFADEIRLAAAMHWYSRGMVSQERAAQIAGLDRTDFLLALARAGVDAFTVDMRSVRRELADE